MAKIDELKQEAQELGITFSPNIGEAKLQEKIDEYYKSQETSSKQIKEAVKAKAKEPTLTNKELNWKQKIAEAEKKARKTRIIEITDNDQRENNHTTTVTVTCGNQHFELGTRILPLNIPVEVEQGFIDVLKEIEIPMHSQKRDGKTTTVIRKRYSISYHDELKKENK